MTFGSAINSPVQSLWRPSFVAVSVHRYVEQTFCLSDYSCPCFFLFPNSPSSGHCPSDLLTHRSARQEKRLCEAGSVPETILFWPHVQCSLCILFLLVFVCSVYLRNLQQLAACISTLWQCLCSTSRQRLASSVCSFVVVFKVVEESNHQAIHFLKITLKQTLSCTCSVTFNTSLCPDDSCIFSMTHEHSVFLHKKCDACMKHLLLCECVQSLKKKALLYTLIHCCQCRYLLLIQAWLLVTCFVCLISIQIRPFFFNRIEKEYGLLARQTEARRRCHSMSHDTDLCMNKWLFSRQTSWGFWSISFKTYKTYYSATWERYLTYQLWNY